MEYCINCGFEDKMTNMNPYWDLINPVYPPKYQCKKCTREIMKKQNADKSFMLNSLVHTCNQPERSKREDLERGCGALNTMEKY